jgi:hypothetical protein
LEFAERVNDLAYDKYVSESNGDEGIFEFSYNGKTYSVVCTSYNKPINTLNKTKIENECKTILRQEKKLLKDLEYEMNFDKNCPEDPEYVKNGRKSYICGFDVIPSIDGITRYDIGIFEMPRQMYGVVRNGQIVKDDNFLFIY